MEPTNQAMPQARHEGLVIQELDDEVLVYDLDRHRSHCLNRTAAFIWRHCDGQTSPAGIAALLHRDFDAPADEQVVWLALRQLDKSYLLRERIELPSELARVSRREVARRLGMMGVGAALLPILTTLIVPTAAAQGSPIMRATCQARQNPNCGGNPCTGLAGTTCQRAVGNNCDCLT
jgi:hypothetical protein